MKKKIISLIAILVLIFSNIGIAVEVTEDNKKNNEVLNTEEIISNNETNIEKSSKSMNNKENNKDDAKERDEDDNEDKNDSNSLIICSQENQTQEISQKDNSEKVYDNNVKEYNQVLEDGEYEIRTVADPQKIFDIDGGITSSGAKLQIWNDSNVPQQRFILKYCGNGSYKITIKKSNKVLDVEGAEVKEGTSIQQYDSNDTDAQRWYIKKNDDNTYSLISKCNNLYITVPNNSYTNGRKLLMYEEDEKESSQKFVFDKIKIEKGTQSIDDGEYEIRTILNSKRIFDIESGSYASQAKLQIWDDCNVTQQRYFVKYIGDGYYKITVRHSNKVLDVEGAGTLEGTGVQQYDSNGTDAQKWIIKENDDGTFFIISKSNNLYLTLANESSNCGTKVLMYEHKDNDMSQKFVFDKVIKEKGKKTLENGEYEIRTAIDSNMIFDIDGGVSESGAKLQLWNDCNVMQQRYILEYIGNGYYKVIVRKSGKVLDVEGASIQEKTKIQQYDSNNTDAQKWIIKRNDDNTYSIISNCNGLYMTLPDSRSSCGTQILMYENKGDISQKFIFEKITEEVGSKTIEDGTYEIRTVLNKNKVFDIDLGSTESGANLQIWEDSNVPQQRFYVRYIGNGLYSITVKKSNKVLDVVNGVMQNENRIQQYDWNNTDAQKWIIRETENGKFNIISKGTGLYLTVEKNEIQNGTRVLTYGKSEKENQEFTFEKVTELNGIDVSVYQGNIDWKAVKESGVDFAMIRVGYRGWGTGKIVYDSNYKYNLENALKNGIKCGVYFYTQAINETEAREEADFIIDAIKQYNITYPVVIDSEESTVAKIGRADKLSVEERTKVCDAFCKRVQERGYTGMIYANKFWLNFNLDMTRLSKYKIWLAHYTGSPGNKTDYNGKYDMWQYTSKGNISGISENVDLNIIF